VLAAMGGAAVGSGFGRAECHTLHKTHPPR
jgi:hypothetical protein